MKESKYILIVLILLGSACEEQTSEDGELVFTKKHWLIGDWKTTAFNGELHETWRFVDDNLQQAGYYIENGDTSYSEIVIISIEDSIPMLRALPINKTVMTYEGQWGKNGKMIFESKVEKEPFQIIYEKVDKKHFKRITKNNDGGIEFENVFEFERQ